MPPRKPETQPKPSENLRRQPTQARAQQTIQTLFKAAAQILDKEGEGGLSTNKVAAAAGFSIGTLYQYFPSKEVLVQASAKSSSIHRRHRPTRAISFAASCAS